MNLRSYLYKSLIFLLAVVVFLTACEEEPRLVVQETRDETIVDFSFEQNNLSTFYRALKISGLDEKLSTGTYTVFAPTDQAFALKLQELGVKELTEVPVEILKDILLYHIVQGQLTSAQLTEMRLDTELNSKKVGVSVGSTISLNGKATVTTNKDNLLKNGVVHVINQVLDIPVYDIPALLKAKSTDDTAPKFTLLMLALERTGFVDALKANTGFTLFAPTDAAFEADDKDAAYINDDANLTELTEFLKYHVLPTVEYFPEFKTARIYTLLGAKGEAQGIDVVAGTEVTLNGVAITQRNLNATNGVIHVVDEVISPDFTNMDVLKGNVPFTGDKKQEAYWVSNFLKAVQIAEYESLFTGEDQYTLFIPAPNTDGVWPGVDFTTLTKEEAQALLNPQIAKGVISLSSLKDGDKITTLAGDVFVTKNKKGTFINGKETSAKYVGTTTNVLLNYPTYNGVASIVTGFFNPLPKTTSVFDVIAALDNYSVMEAALIKTGLDKELKTLTNNFTVFAPINEALLAALKALKINDLSALNALNPDVAADAKKIDAVKALLQDHIVQAVEFHIDLSDQVQLTALSTKTFSTEMYPAGSTDAQLVVRDTTLYPANFVRTTDSADIDLIATNGVVHGIDKVLEL